MGAPRRRCRYAIAILAGPLSGGAGGPTPSPAAGSTRPAAASSGVEPAGEASGGGGGSPVPARAGGGVGAPASGTTSTASDRVVLHQVETPVSRTTVSSEPQDPDDPDQGLVCLGDSDGSFVFCAEDALAAVPLPG